MSVNLEIREMLPEDSIVFDNMSYDRSIIGTTLDGRVIYDYDLMVEELMEDENWSYEEAVDWIDYNTLGALPSCGGKAPIIVVNFMV